MIPTGLQALIEASAVLNQEASPVAPGPQGPQPTVASQIGQRINQLAQPAMQDIGRQAGIAGQLFAQRQAQQQQMAQNPQAVAQMAAQMLQSGVGALPVNMQFKEGGIIGFAGPEGSFVEDAMVRDRAPRRSRRNVLLEDYPYADAPTEPEEEVKGLLEQQRAIRAEQNKGLAQVLEQDRPIRSVVPSIVQGAKDIYEKIQEAGDINTYLDQSRGAQTEKMIDLSGLDQLMGPPQAYVPETRTPPAAARPPVEADRVVPPRIVTPQLPATPTAQGILAALPEDQESAKIRGEIKAAGEKLLKTRQEQPDLEQEGIASLQRTREEQKKLLSQQRERDTFNRLIGLLRDIRYHGNEYGAVDAAIQRREEAAIQADAAHDQAVMKMKQAQQARAIGNAQLEMELKKQGFDFLDQEKKRRLEIAKIDGELKGREYTAQSQAAIHTADAQNKQAIETQKMIQAATERKDMKIASLLQSAGSKINEGYKTLEGLREKYPMAAMATPETLKDPTTKAQYQEFQNARNDIIKNVIEPAIAERNRLAAQLEGVAPPAPSAAPPSRPTIKYDASGKPVK